MGVRAQVCGRLRPCAPLTLAWLLWRTTGSVDHVDGRFREAATAIVTLWRSDQEHELGSFVLRRLFSRRGDALSHRGRGAPIARTGMTWSGFRPSDDACVYGPTTSGEMRSPLLSLERLAELITGEPLAEEARTLASRRSVTELPRHGVVDDPVAGRIYAYEVDGLGHTLLLDDANVPSLVSLPYLGFCARRRPPLSGDTGMGARPREPALVRRRLDPGSRQHTHSTRLRLAAGDRDGRPDRDRRRGARGRTPATGGHRGRQLPLPRVNPPTMLTRFTRRWFSPADMLYVELVLAAAGVALPG